MKLIYLITLLILCSPEVSARDRGVSLNEAVNQAKSQGKVLSARTTNGQHEVKVLQPNGSVKTIHKKARHRSNFTNNGQNPHGGAGTWHDQLKNERMPSRNQNTSRNQSKSRNVMRLKDRNSRSDLGRPYNNQNTNGRDAQRLPNRNTTRTIRNKDKDN